MSRSYLIVALTQVLATAVMPAVGAHAQSSSGEGTSTAPSSGGGNPPGGSNSAPAPASANPNSGGGAAPAPGAAPESGASTALDYLYNRRAAEGTAAREVQDANARSKTKIMAMDALGVKQISDPQSRARFDKFLTMTEATPEQLKAYSTDLATVLTLLSTKKNFDAWLHLRKLASYETIDAGVSWELANRIESVWSVDKARDSLARENKVHDDNAARNIRSAEFMAESFAEKERRNNPPTSGGGRSRDRGNKNGGVPMAPESAPGGGGGTPGAPAMGNMMEKLQMTEEYLQSLEAKANKKINELKSQKLAEGARTDFAEYITTLYNSGRYRHVLIAADFWRRLFDQDNYPVSMGQQVNASLEISREVQGSVDAFRTNLAENDVAAATERLQEAYMRSEFHPALLGLKRADKKRVETFLKKLAKMQNVIEARDFATLEEIVKELKTDAPDYDATKPLAIVNAVKLESQLRLGKARMAAQQGDTKQAMAEFQAAAEAWPGNPELKDKALTFFNTQDVQNQSLVEFDRLVKEDNYRGIFEKQLVFAPSMKDDVKRQDQLKAALEKVKLVETTIEKANGMRNMGNVFGAWETVELAVVSLPNDLKLNALRGELTGKAVEFVAAINKAKDAESRKELGYSLTWYAIAQRQYPNSQMANEAMNRISKEILEKSSL